MTIFRGEFCRSFMRKFSLKELMLIGKLLCPNLTYRGESVSKRRRRRLGFCRSGWRGATEGGVGSVTLLLSLPLEIPLSERELLIIYIRENTKIKG